MLESNEFAFLLSTLLFILKNIINCMNNRSPSLLHLPLLHLSHLPSWMCNTCQNNIQRLKLKRERQVINHGYLLSNCFLFPIKSWVSANDITSRLFCEKIVHDINHFPIIASEVLTCAKKDMRMCVIGYFFIYSFVFCVKEKMSLFRKNILPTKQS